MPFFLDPLFLALCVLDWWLRATGRPGVGAGEPGEGGAA